MKRRICMMTAFAVLTAALPAIATAADKKVVVYTPSGDYLKSINVTFEQETGIKVQMIEAGSGELIKRLQAEASRPLGDVVAAMSTDLLDQSRNLLEVPQSGTWPGFSKVVSGVFIVNTDALGNLPAPKSWKDFANPIYKGKIAYAGADKSGSAYAQLATVLGVYGEEQGWKVLEAALPNLIITNSSSKVVSGVARGEYAIGITGEDAAFVQKKAGAPVTIVYPTEGIVTYADGSAVIKGAANQTAAEDYISYLSRPEVQKIVVDKFHRRPVAIGVSPPEGLPTHPQEANLEKGFLETLDRDATIRKYLSLVRQ
jgi:iron(III) transport system substrate-binding protein